MLRNTSRCYKTGENKLSCPWNFEGSALPADPLKDGIQQSVAEFQTIWLQFKTHGFQLSFSKKLDFTCDLHRKYN